MSPAIRRYTLKCPDCGLPKGDTYYGHMRLHMLFCRHMTAAKPTVEETREAWNVLATSVWQRKSTTSTRDQPPDSATPARSN